MNKPKPKLRLRSNPQLVLPAKSKQADKPTFAVKDWTKKTPGALTVVGKARIATPAEQYAIRKGYPPVPRWAKDLSPAVLEAHKYIVYRDHPDWEAPHQKQFQEDLVTARNMLARLKGKPNYKGACVWWIFYHDRLGALYDLHRVVVGTPEQAAKLARQFFPEKVGHMALKELSL